MFSHRPGRGCGNTAGFAATFCWHVETMRCLCRLIGLDLLQDTGLSFYVSKFVTLVLLQSVSLETCSFKKKPIMSTPDEKTLPLIGVVIPSYPQHSHT